MNQAEQSSKELQGLVTVVTGSAQGLGLGMVESLAKLGAHAIIADVQTEKAETEAARASEHPIFAVRVDCGISGTAHLENRPC